MRGQRRVLSFGEAWRAVTLVFAHPTCTRPWGSAFRLTHQPGLRSSPPLEPMTTKSSPSLRYSNGAVRLRPLLRPVVVSSRMSILPKRPPMTPPVARYRHLLMSVASRIISRLLGGAIYVPPDRP